MATDLNTLINAIPTAEDGHVITPDYHNTLRAAMIALASQSGTSQGGGDVTLTYAPVFLPVTDAGVQAPAWVLSLGIASRPTSDAGGQVFNAKGWFLVNLPDGMRIRTLTVTGNRSGLVFACKAQLLRFQIADAETATLVTVLLTDLSGQFTKTGQFSGGVPPEFQVVDNANCHYLISADLTKAKPDAVVDLYAFQVRLTGSNK